MPYYFLRKYRFLHYEESRNGVLESEWALFADDHSGAYQAAERQLEQSGFDLRENFAILFDNSHQYIWDKNA